MAQNRGLPCETCVPRHSLPQFPGCRVCESSSLQDRETCVLRHEPRKGNLYSVARTPESPGGCVPPNASLSRHIRFIAFKHIELILELLVNRDVSPRSEYANRYFHSSSINGAVVDPVSFDGRRAPEQRSPLRNLRSATQSPAIPRGRVSEARPSRTGKPVSRSTIPERETCIL